MWIPIAIVGVLVLWVVVSYNLLVRARNIVSEAWSGIDVQLKRRHDLIPNIVECVKAYSSHERELFENVAGARATGLGSDAIPARAEAENAVTGQLKALFAVAEAYPDLKANTNFLELQKGLTEVEDDIQYARRYYNASVRDYNIRAQSFPGLIIAGLFGFEKKDYFEIEYATERQTPDAKFE
jgi:LemA protein